MKCVVDSGHTVKGTGGERSRAAATQFVDGARIVAQGFFPGRPVVKGMRLRERELGN